MKCLRNKKKHIAKLEMRNVPPLAGLSFSRFKVRNPQSEPNLLLVIFLLITLCQGVSFAQPKIEPKLSEANKVEPVPAKFNVSDFTYTSSNRRDPFEPIFLTDPKRQGKANVLRKGYELEELKLVGVMKDGNKNLAMMEDTQGKGILFKKNDYLNKNLWIVDILAEKVRFGYKIKGEMRTFTIEIPRKKEGM